MSLSSVLHVRDKEADLKHLSEENFVVNFDACKFYVDVIE